MSKADVLKILFDSNEGIGLKINKKHGSAYPEHICDVIEKINESNHELVQIHPFCEEHIPYYDCIQLPNGDYEDVHLHRRTCSEHTITAFRSFVVELDPDKNIWNKLSDPEKESVLVDNKARPSTAPVNNYVRFLIEALFSHVTNTPSGPAAVVAFEAALAPFHLNLTEHGVRRLVRRAGSAKR